MENKKHIKVYINEQQHAESMGIILKTIRRDNDMSLRQFSEIIGISHCYLGNLERGVNRRTNTDISPTLDITFKIADNLGIPRLDFLKMFLDL